MTFGRHNPEVMSTALKTRVRGVLGQIAFDLSMALLNWALDLPCHGWRCLVFRRAARVSLGSDVSLARGVRLTVRGGVQIGDRSIVNGGVLLDGRGNLFIGDDVNISPGVTVWTSDHDPASPEFTGRNRPVRIGSRSWIASQAIILPGSVVGEGCVVGAGSVVHGEIRASSIVVGNPARVIGTRPHDAQARLNPYRRFFH